MRILFAGTPDFAAAHLKTLIDCGRHEILAVYTQPDRPAGRGKRLVASPVKQLAEQAGLRVEQPNSLKDAESQQQLASYDADLLVVVAYGLLLPSAVLDAPKFGCVNVHASLLPRWRGAAPVERAIEAGDQESGVTIMQMDEGLDTGPMLKRVSFTLSNEETGDSLRQRLIETGGNALIEVLDQIANGESTAEQQDDSEANYASKLKKSEALLDFNLPASVLQRKIRAFHSALPCHGLFKEQRIKMISATHDDKPSARDYQPGEIIAVDKQHLLIACGEGSLSVSELQLPGGKTMGLAALLNGRPDYFKPGDCFTLQQE